MIEERASDHEKIRVKLRIFPGFQKSIFNSHMFLQKEFIFKKCAFERKLNFHMGEERERVSGSLRRVSE